MTTPNNKTNMQTITITLTNIPDDELDYIWRSTIRHAKKYLGIPIERVDAIEIDASVLEAQFPQGFAELMSNAITGHAIMTAEKILNK